MTYSYRARIYPNGSSEGIAVDLAFDESENLVASDGQRSARWPLDQMHLKLGGCSEDRLVMSCPSGDTIISTDLSLLNALSQSCLQGAVEDTRRKHSAAKFRKNFSMFGVVMLWFGVPMLVILPFIAAVCIGFWHGMENAKSDKPNSADTVPADQAQTVEEEEAQKLLERYEEFVNQHIAKHWHPAKYNRPLKATAEFTINANGTVSDFEFTEPSGSKTFDKAAKSAVMDHQPLPKPPDGAIRYSYDFD